MWHTGAYNAAVIISITPKSWFLLWKLLCVGGAVCALMLMHKAFLGGRMLPLQCCRRHCANGKKEKKKAETYALLSVTAVCHRKRWYSSLHTLSQHRGREAWRNTSHILKQRERDCRKCLSVRGSSLGCIHLLFLACVWSKWLSDSFCKL